MRPASVAEPDTPCSFRVPPPSGGLLVYSYYYATDVPDQTQRRANYAWVMALAVVGVSVRYYVDKWCGDIKAVAPSPSGVEADGYLQAVVFHDLVANMLGSLIMGLVTGLSPWSLPRFPALHVGLTTGLCGCLTTFSSFNNEVAALMIYGSAARGFMALAIGVAVPLAALNFGFRVGGLLDARLKAASKRPTQDEEAATGVDAPASKPDTTGVAPVPPYPMYNTYKLPVGLAALVLLLCGLSAFAAVAVANDNYGDGELAIGLLVAPFFAAIRYALSSYNRGHPRFPVWTLVCNASASLMTTLASVLVHTPAIGASRETKMVLEALSLGAAGSLSTVSTFMNELRLLPTPHAHVYAAVTLLVGQAIALPLWAGFRELR